MSEEFIEYLISLKKKDKRAMAVLRRSVGSELGKHEPSYSYIERFVPSKMHEDDPFRKAIYLTAGLFSHFPEHATEKSFAQVFGESTRSSKNRQSFERRFSRLLCADVENIAIFLRQSMQLIGKDKPINYVKLLKDLRYWSNEKTKLHWARDFYASLEKVDESLQTKEENNK